MPHRSKRFALDILPSTLVAVMVVTALTIAVMVTLSQLYQHQLTQTMNQLASVNNAVDNSLQRHVNNMALDAEHLLLENDTRSWVMRLYQPAESAAAIMPLRRILAKRLFPAHYMGAYLISAQHRILLSFKTRDQGHKVPESIIQASGSLQSGVRHLLTHPFIWQGKLQQWLLLPVIANDGHFLGTMALVLGRQQSLNALTRVQVQARQSMESYLIDTKGIMLSASRFHAGLIQRGLLPDGGNEVATLPIRDPGRDLRLTPTQPDEVAAWPLTLAVQQASQKSDGGSATAYRNYRGVSVFGVWRWNSLLQAAIITEIDEAEALADYRYGRNLVLLLVALISITVFASALLYNRQRLRLERQSSQQRDRLINAAAEAIMGIDKAGRVTFVNDSFCHMFHLEKKVILGHNPFALLHKSHQDGSPVEQCIIHQTLLNGAAGHRDNEQFQAAGQQPIAVEYWSHPVYENDQLTACVVTILDISDKRAAEQEHQHLEKQVQHAQRLESLGVLAGGIAHDFNNLLAVILGNASLAEMTLAKEPLKARDYLHHISRSGERAAVLCKQMLAYSGKGQFVLKQLDLSAIVDEMSHLLEVSIDKSVVMRYHLTEGLPAVVADEAQLQQVIMNLVTNANDAIGGKSGIISLTTGMMQADADYLADCFGDIPQPGRYLYMEVSDTGCGMSKTTLEKIFDPFYSTKATGRGLGMSAVLGIVRGHKGALKIYSERKRGSTFKFLLPTLHEHAQSEQKAPHATPSMPRFSGTVLVVDDEETVREMTCAMLEEMGFSTLSAADGRQALACYQQQAQNITLVLTDLTMPRMGGKELFSALKAINPDCPILLTSGYNSQESIQQFAGKGLAGFVQKPFTRSQLAAVIAPLFVA